MSQLFDRLNHELEVFGRRAQAALDEGKVQIEALRLRRQRDGAARDLGLLIHRRERGLAGEIEPRRIEALLLRLDDLLAQIARLEVEVAERRRSRRPENAPATPPADGGTTAGTGAGT